MSSWASCEHILIFLSSFGNVLWWDNTLMSCSLDQPEVLQICSGSQKGVYKSSWTQLYMRVFIYLLSFTIAHTLLFWGNIVYKNMLKSDGPASFSIWFGENFKLCTEAPIKCWSYWLLCQFAYSIYSVNILKSLLFQILLKWKKLCWYLFKWCHDQTN